MNWHDIFATRMDRMKASEIRELLKLLDQPDIISFAGGIPDPALFPTEAFQTAMADALSPGNAKNALQYSVSEGYAPLRDWIVGEMGRIGVPCLTGVIAFIRKNTGDQVSDVRFIVDNQNVMCHYVALSLLTDGL